MGVFIDNKPIECEACGDLIYAGSTYQKLTLNGKKHCCCSYVECQEQLLFKLFQDEFEEMKLYTSEELADIWADKEG